MSECENSQLPVAERAVHSRISNDVWEQVKTAYASGIGLREIARNMNIPEGTVLARAKREGWSKQISDAKSLAKRDDTPPTVTEAVAVTLRERKDKTKLHLSRYAVEASEKAANHRQKLKIARQVKDVAAVAESVWPAEKQEGPSLLLVNIGLLGIDPRTVAVRDTDAEG